MSDEERGSIWGNDDDSGSAFNFQWLADIDGDGIPDDLQQAAPPAASAAVEAAPANLQRASSVTAFEDLTLAQAFSQMWGAPFQTLSALVAVSQLPARRSFARSYAGAAALPAVRSIASAPVRLPDQPVEAEQLYQDESAVIESAEPRISRLTEAIQLVVRLVALIIALIGSAILSASPNRTEASALVVGAPILLVAFIVWLASEFIGWRWQFAPRKDAETAPPMDGVQIMVRGLLLIGGIAASGLAWRLNLDNQFTPEGFIAWMVSIVLCASALAESDWSYAAAFQQMLRRVQRFRPHWSWTVFALALILALGAFFRLTDLPGTPPEMTSDHVEKLLDAHRVTLGFTNVFFANNGGREPTQMYLMALLSQIPGLGMDFTTLKLLSALEGLVAVLLMFWLGREVIGREQGNLSIAVGLMLAALVAVSYWHTALSRLGLRIVLTTVVATLLVIFLARAMRDNRRNDFLKAGLALGFGLYTYQAVRMLPVIVIVGVLLAVIYRTRSWEQFKRCALNFASLVFIAFVVFVPLFAYSLQYPDDFWRRTQGRLLGDEIIQETDANGNIVARRATMEERLEAFGENIPILLSNIRNALLMFNWKGDVAWINGAPNYPAMSIVSGALLILGLAAWIGRIIRRRDPVDLLIPLMVFIMLLPSALSIAFPVENPSATRASGALPAAFLLAAYPLALLALSTMRLLGNKFGGALAALGVSALVIGSFVQDANTYFGEYRRSYLISSLPYTEAGRVLREFAAINGYGNAFMIAYPYWWDHRAIGIEAGVMNWPNGLLSVTDVPGALFSGSQIDDDYVFDYDKDMLFFYAPTDIDTERQLQAWFPNGFFTEQISYQPEDSYRLFFVPALGADAFSEFIERNYASGQ